MLRNLLAPLRDTDSAEYDVLGVWFSSNVHIGHGCGHIVSVTSPVYLA